MNGLLVVILMAGVMAGVGPPVAVATEPVPGVPVGVNERGPVTTSDDCRTGEHNRVRHYGSGQGSVCLGAEDTVVLYAGGVPTCGGVTVADRAFGQDPNTCPEAMAMEAMVRQRLTVQRPDGVVLDGFVWRAERLSEQPLPIVLVSSTYFGSFRPPLDSPALFGDPYYRRLVTEGFALAVYSVRGTGTSGGCYDFFGKREQDDQASIVEVLADQEFSNGAVAMLGLSAESATAWSAAVAAPKPLRAIVTAGNLVDPYLNVSTPQGAARPFGARWATGTGVVPWGFFTQAGFMARHGFVTSPQSDPDGYAGRYSHALAQRLCPGTEKMAVSTLDLTVTNDRNEAFWAERRLTDRLRNVKAASLVTHGFGDGHLFQEDNLWRALRGAPKRMLLGPWGHQFPPIAATAASTPDWAKETERPSGTKVGGFERVMVEWLDHWLRQPLDDAEATATSVREGVVDHQATDGNWHTADAWPPKVQSEVLTLDGSTLKGAAPTAQGAARSFLSVPDAVTTGVELGNRDNEWAPFAGATCGSAGPMRHLNAVEMSSTRTALMWEGKAVGDKPVHIAGNPSLRVRVESSEPGGLVMWQLLDLGPGFHCDDGTPHDARAISFGGVDLRFARGNFVAAPPTPGQVLELEIDLYNDSYILEPGRRLALTASYGDIYDRSSSPLYSPIITVHGGSQVVLPVARGSLGGEKPKLKPGLR